MVAPVSLVFFAVAWYGWLAVAWIIGLGLGFYLLATYPMPLLLGLVLLLGGKRLVRRKVRSELVDTGLAADKSPFGSLSKSSYHYHVTSPVRTSDPGFGEEEPAEGSLQSVETVLSRVDMMRGDEFEEWLAQHFLEAGYSVRWVGRGGSDQGADLILEIPHRRIAVQAKRQNSRVGNSAVQEVVAARHYYGTDEAWVITNNYFTAKARQLAEGTSVRLIDRDGLVRWLQGTPVDSVHSDSDTRDP